MFKSFLSDGEPKLIAVMGATGAQGGSVVKAFHEEGTKDFEVRAITRNPDSDKAKAIESMVKEVIQADADDEASMVKAFEGCYGAFVVTNFWEDMDMNHEIEQTRKIQAAAKKAGVKHVILSTLPDTRDFVKNKAENKDTWKVLLENDGFNSYVPHFDSKGSVSADFAAAVPTTLFETSFYYENFIYFGMGPVQHAPDTPYAITFPMKDAKLPMVSVRDFGRQIVPIFKDEKTIGTKIGVASEILTCKEIADTFTKVCGYEVVYNDVPVEVYASFGFPGAEDLANMFRYKVENEEEFCSLRDVAEIEKLMGQPTHKFEEWLTDNKAAFAPKPATEAEEQTDQAEVKDVEEEAAEGEAIPKVPYQPKGAECCTIQ